LFVPAEKGIILELPLVIQDSPPMYTPQSSFVFKGIQIVSDCAFGYVQRLRKLRNA
jgi:hypothetical protein